MQVIITKQIKQNDSHLFEINCGKKTAHIWVSASHVMVCCLNASHRAWGGLGKRFDNLQQAVNGYKSSEMKAIIQAAAEAI